MKSPRFAPLTGAIFVVLLVIGFIPLGGDTPETDASAAKIISFYNDHQTREILAIIAVALAGAVPGFVRRRDPRLPQGYRRRRVLADRCPGRRGGRCGGTIRGWGHAL